MTIQVWSFLFLSHLHLLPFPFPSQIYMPCSHLPPFLIRSITRHVAVTVLRSHSLLVWRSLYPSKIPAQHLSVVLCICPSHPKPLTLSTKLDCLCLDSDSEVFVNPACCIILTHCHFDIALLPSWTVSSICFLFAFLLFVLQEPLPILFEATNYISRWAQMRRLHPPWPIVLACTTQVVRRSCLFQPICLSSFW